MANSGFYNPEGYNPYDDVLEGKRSDGEANWGDNKSLTKSDRKNEESQDFLRGVENSALAGGFYQNSGPNDNKKNNKGKLNGLGNKKGIAVVGLILILVVGFGIFLGSSHSLLGPALSAKSLEQLDSMNAAQEIEVAMTLGCISSGECEGELSDEVIAALEANGVEVGDDKKSLYYNGENISGDRLPEIINENVEVRSAVDSATLGQVVNTLDETAINIDNNRGISKNMFVDFEQSNNIEEDLDNYNEIVNEKISGQLTTNTYTQQEKVNYKTGKWPDGTTCNVNKSNQCTDNDEEWVMASHNSETNSSTGATTTASTKEEATDAANSYINKISTNVTKMATWNCTALRLGQLLSATAAANEKRQSEQIYSSVMEPISKMMDGDGAKSPYHAVMTKLIEETTATIHDYANATITGTNPEGGDTVSVGTKDITGSAITATATVDLLTGTNSSIEYAFNYSYERTNATLNASLNNLDGSFTQSCNTAQNTQEDFSEGSGLFLHTTFSQKIAELITRGMSISVSTTRGSGNTQTTGGLAWKGTKSFTKDVLGKFIKKFFVNVNLSNYIQFMNPAFGETSYANANDIYKGVEFGEAFVRGGAAYFTDLGVMGSGQTGADDATSAAYNNLTKTVIAQRAEVDRYSRSPFDINSPNTFLGSIAYSFLPLTTNKTFSGLSSLMRNTGSSLASLMGVASAATNETYYSDNGDCARLKDINATGDRFCNRKAVTSPKALEQKYSDPDYQKFLSENIDGDGNLIEDSDGARFVSYCNLRLSPPGILDANIAEDFDNKKTPLQRIKQFLSSIFSFLGADFTDDDSGWIDSSYCNLSDENPKKDTIEQASMWTLRQRILIQLGVIKYDESPLTAYVEKHWDKFAPTDSTDYLAKITGMTYEDAELVQDTIAYYTFLDGYDIDSRIAMDEHPTDPETGEQVVAKINAEDQRIGDGEKHEPIILIDQQIAYADVRNRSYTV